MNKFKLKLLSLFLTFTIGVAVYLIYCLLPFSGDKIPNAIEISSVKLVPFEEKYEETFIEIDFYAVSPCEDKNLFKQYAAKSKGTINGGVVNQRVSCGILPDFKSENNFSATVKIDVLIDQFGEIEEAKIKQGHELVNELALRAARQIRFSPMMLGGEPHKVRGVLIYNFDNDGVKIPKMSKSFYIKMRKSF